MKVLLDSCVWGGARASLTAGGHEVDWAGAWPSDPGDDEILERAAANGAVLITIDKDFGELAVVHGRRHCGIIRLVCFAAHDQGPACVAALTRYGSELRTGALVTVERSRIRIRPADGPSV